MWEIMSFMQKNVICVSCLWGNIIENWYSCSWGFPRGSGIANAGDLASIPGSGRSPGGGNGNPLQYSCLGNPTDREAWWATVHGVTRDRI